MQQEQLGETASTADQPLLERIRRLEEAVQHEREARQREVRVLREALAPFYKNEEQMHRKLVELEDRVEGNYDEQVRIRDQVVALDDANMGLEKRIEEAQNNAKRRRLSPHEPRNMPTNNSGDERRQSNNTDRRSISSVSSHALSSGSHISPPPQEPEEPRSSGILNLIDINAHTRRHPPPARNIPVRSYEARSSGFLALDLADRFARRTIIAPYPPAYSTLQSPPDYAQSDTDAACRRVGDTNEVLDMSPRKRKHVVDHMALDMLAEVSSASPLIR